MINALIALISTIAVFVIYFIIVVLATFAAMYYSFRREMQKEINKTERFSKNYPISPEFIDIDFEKLFKLFDKNEVKMAEALVSIGIKPENILDSASIPRIASALKFHSKI